MHTPQNLELGPDEKLWMKALALVNWFDVPVGRHLKLMPRFYGTLMLTDERLRWKRSLLAWPIGPRFVEVNVDEITECKVYEDRLVATTDEDEYRFLIFSFLFGLPSSSSAEEWRRLICVAAGLPRSILRPSATIGSPKR